MNTGLYRDSHCVVDFDHHATWLDDHQVRLTRKEFELLAELVSSAGETVPRDSLLLNVWGYGPQIRTRTLDVHIRRLRRKLGIYGERQIETAFGIGYRFQPESGAAASLHYLQAVPA